MIFSSLVTATITVNSATPINNSAYFSVNQVIATISASDNNSLPLNYTFRVKPSVWFDEENYTTSGTVDSYTEGTSPINLHQLETSGTGDTASATRIIHFNTDQLLIYLNASDTSCTVSYVITINGTTVFSRTGDFQTELRRIDVSSYNDGQGYPIVFNVNDGCGASNGAARIVGWWIKSYHANSTLDVGSPVYSYSITRQNSSNNNYTLNSTSLHWMIHPFSWNATIYNNNSELSQVSDRYVTFVNYTDCISTDNFTTNIFNIRDESTSNLLSGTIETSITLTGNNTANSDTKTYGFMYTGSSTYYACLTPNNYPVVANNFLTYTPTSADYTTLRQYIFSDTIFTGGLTETFDLYAINDSLATTVVVTLKRDGSLIEGGLIQLLRYDVSNVSSRTVQMCQTSNTGTCALFAELNTQLYQIIVTIGGTTVLSTAPNVLTSSSLTLNLPSTSSDPTQNFRNAQGVTYLLNYDDNGTFTCTYTDDDNTQITVDLEVRSVDSRLISLVGSDTVTSTSGTLSVSVPIVNGTTYEAKCLATFSSNKQSLLEILIITIPFGQITNWGATGWIIFSLITITLSFVFIYSPLAALVLNAFSIIAHKAIGIIDLDWSVVIGIVFVLFLIAAYTRLDRK